MVSIPYRQSRIPHLLFSFQQIVQCFNSLQVVQNPGQGITDDMKFICFNSLQVVQNLGTLQKVIQDEKSFNSLQVVQNLVAAFFAALIGAGFNSLQVVQNQCSPRNIRSYIASFNSLQVVQNRGTRNASSSGRSRFQFLIGSLESYAVVFRANVGYLFQFLIGSLESLLSRRGSSIGSCVSIPYRQSRIQLSHLWL